MQNANQQETGDVQHLAGLGDPPPTSQNFDKSLLTKILSLPFNAPLHLVWHPLPSISQSPNLVYIN